jgi:putative alpha-1,2-mannosidase
MSEISELFAKDPLSLTKEDRTAIIAHYRENRERYMQGAKLQTTEKAPKTPKEKAVKGPKITLSLSDLKLNL